MKKNEWKKYLVCWQISAKSLAFMEKLTNLSLTILMAFFEKICIPTSSDALTAIPQTINIDQMPPRTIFWFVILTNDLTERKVNNFHFDIWHLCGVARPE